MSSRINKPKPSKFTNTASKSSDRRLAAGRQPAKFLHNVVAAQASNVHISTAGSNSSSGNKSYNAPSSDTKTVKRSVGDKSWEDSSLLEWNPKHFRLFVGNLGPDANDELLASAFGKFKTMSKVKVPTDNKSGKNKGYGFVSFESPDDYFMAFKEMNGKYIGQHPVQLKRAETNIKPVKKGRRGGR
ncbi:hypothetical protein CLIB1423_10S00782 [[Candida] railenensis]|uniref:RRM domain-containing protein n=1 Tax=[Candida] railenensis TaxID=45579 RepID=A0A9P0QPT4_9ASCO|nr:hypothetical protein CLIB1423_10S00782 [[Candida] railenensis]